MQLMFLLPASGSCSDAGNTAVWCGLGWEQVNAWRLLGEVRHSHGIYPNSGSEAGSQCTAPRVPAPLPMQAALQPPPCPAAMPASPWG